jgi:hypothetical protein
VGQTVREIHIDARYTRQRLQCRLDSCDTGDASRHARDVQCDEGRVGFSFTFRALIWNTDF